MQQSSVIIKCINKFEPFLWYSTTIRQAYGNCVKNLVPAVCVYICDRKSQFCYLPVEKHSQSISAVCYVAKNAGWM